jgi:hypothetical protein
MAKGRSLWNNSYSYSDSDFDVSDDLNYDGIFFKVHKLEDAFCSQDKLLCRVFFVRTKTLILSLKILLLKLLPST